MLVEHLIYSTALAIFIGMIHYRFFNRDYSWIIIVSAYVPDLDVISDSLLKKMGITVLVYGHTIVHGYFHNIAILTIYAIFMGFLLHPLALSRNQVISRFLQGHHDAHLTVTCEVRSNYPSHHKIDAHSS